MHINFSITRDFLNNRCFLCQPRLKVNDGKHGAFPIFSFAQKLILKPLSHEWSRLRMRLKQQVSDFCMLSNIDVWTKKALFNIVWLGRTYPALLYYNKLKTNLSANFGCCHFIPMHKHKSNSRNTNYVHKAAGCILQYAHCDT